MLCAWSSPWSVLLLPLQREEVTRKARSKRGMNVRVYMYNVRAVIPEVWKNNDVNVQWVIINKVWVFIYLLPFCSDSNPCIGCIMKLFSSLYADKVLQKQVICLEFLQSGLAFFCLYQSKSWSSPVANTLYLNVIFIISFLCSLVVLWWCWWFVFCLFCLFGWLVCVAF